MPSGTHVRREVARKALEVVKQRIRESTRPSGGRSLPTIAERLGAYVPGRKAHFQLAETSTVIRGLDVRIRRRLRAAQLKHWRRGGTTYREPKEMDASATDALAVAVDRAVREEGIGQET